MPKRIKRSQEVSDRFEYLRDFILEWHGATETKGLRLIGQTEEGNAVALIWEDDPHVDRDTRNVLTFRRMEEILDEGENAGLKKPARIWAEGSTAPIIKELYRFHQLGVNPRDPEGKPQTSRG